jgi:hypothetical protein
VLSFTAQPSITDAKFSAYIEALTASFAVHLIIYEFVVTVIIGAKLLAQLAIRAGNNVHSNLQKLMRLGAKKSY